MTAEDKKNTPVRIRTIGMTDEDAEAIRRGHFLRRRSDGAYSIVSPKQADALAEVGGFTFTYGDELAKPLPPVVWGCKQFGIVQGRPSLLSGYAGAGKTWFAIDFAIATAAGLPTIWGGIPIELNGKVRHLDYENLKGNTQRRYQRVAAGRRVSLRSLGDRFGLAALPTTYLTDESAYELLCRACDGVALAIDDSLRASCPDVDENSSTIRRYLDVLTRVTAATGTIFLVLVHEGKDPAEGRSHRPTAQRTRGSSAISDAVDASIHISHGDEANGFRIEQGKCSWRQRGDSLTVRLVDDGPLDASGLSKAVVFELVDEAVEPGLSTSLQRCMASIRELLQSSDRPLGSTEIRELVTGKNATINSALAILRERHEVIQDTATKLYTMSPCPPASDDGQPEDERTADRTAPREIPRSRVFPRVPGTREEKRVPVSPSFRRGHASGTGDTPGKNGAPGTRQGTRPPNKLVQPPKE